MLKTIGQKIAKLGRTIKAKLTKKNLLDAADATVTTALAAVAITLAFTGHLTVRYMFTPFANTLFTPMWIVI